MSGAGELSGVAEVLAAVRAWGYETAAYKALGDIAVARQGELLLFNYTPRATYARRWNAVERVCRGLIVHVPSATVRALPFAKFFNLGEVPETQIAALPAGPVEVTAKMDGSLGIVYGAADGPAIATRGSFAGAQAVWATAHLRAHYDLRDLPADLTLLCEIIYPANRIILNYGSLEALVLLGARRFDGNELAYPELAALAGRYGFPLVPAVQVGSVADLLPWVESVGGSEGWVVRWPNGLRVKIKTAEYLRLHRARYSLTAETVRAALLTGEWPAFLLALPEEFQPEARALAATVEARVAAETARLAAIFASVQAALPDLSRKTFAIQVQAHHLADAGYLFELWQGKPLRPLILRRLDLRDLGARLPVDG
ncbi:MAG: T4 RnlA family RNA ligase [Chloroflexota bacterium]|nr:T4 RnlA family RNA ligase [Chloroflexota bacterium]